MLEHKTDMWLVHELPYINNLEGPSYTKNAMGEFYKWLTHVVVTLSLVIFHNQRNIFMLFYNPDISCMPFICHRDLRQTLRNQKSIFMLFYNRDIALLQLRKSYASRFFSSKITPKLHFPLLWLRAWMSFPSFKLA